MTELLHDRYRLDEVIGQGAMGVVWRAHDEVLDRPIAIKELRPAPGVDPTEALDRFLVEARAAARLSHPNIVGVHDVFSDGERVLIVMELIEGPTLDLVVGSQGAQSPEIVRAVMAQVAQALAKAHGAGVIHRDLKPDNIFWTQDRAVVADFGLARIGGGRGTVEGTVMGTPGYMAPEQIKGTAVGPPADIFGWGAVAYYLASGTAPFGEQEQTDSSALAYRIVHQDPPPLVLRDDPALAGLIAAALAKDPAQRPYDGVALVGRLTEGLGRVENQPPMPAPPTTYRPSSQSSQAALPTRKAIQRAQPAPTRLPATHWSEKSEPPAIPKWSGWTIYVIVIGIITAAVIIGVFSGLSANNTPEQGLSQSSQGPYLGVRFVDSATYSRGVDLVEVVTGSPAAMAGLEAGDTIVYLGGVEVSDSSGFSSAVEGLVPGAEVAVAVWRNNTYQYLTITAGRRP